MGSEIYQKSWADVTVKNNDGHTVIQNGRQKKKADSVYIGNHVWLCSYSTVLKGVNVGNHCVVGYGSLLTKAEPENHIFIRWCSSKTDEERN